MAAVDAVRGLVLSPYFLCDRSENLSIEKRFGTIGGGTEVRHGGLGTDRHFSKMFSMDFSGLGTADRFRGFAPHSFPCT